VVLLDVNVLVYAHRADAARHDEYRAWLEDTINADRAYGVADLVLSGFLRVVTHAGVFKEPTPLDKALAFAHELRDQPNCVRIAPRDRHWGIFTRLCREVGAAGNLVPDCWLAALAIESGSEWITTDRDFARFAELKHRHPLRPRA
jgi:toxin-antitoxin system PIN domain toxin